MIVISYLLKIYFVDIYYYRKNILLQPVNTISLSLTKRGIRVQKSLKHFSSTECGGRRVPARHPATWHSPTTVSIIYAFEQTTKNK